MRRRKARGRNVTYILILLAVLSVAILARPTTLASRYSAAHITIDLRGGKYEVIPVIANGADGSEMFQDMVSRSKAISAITGTYFDERMRPMGDIVADGRVISRGRQRQAVGFTRDGKIVFLERRGSSRINWSGITSGIACGPRLVRDGKVSIQVRKDGFSLVAETRVAPRCAVGADTNNRLILCATEQAVTLKTMGLIMVELGALNAVNMDGGASTALYHSGGVRVSPLTTLSNILVVRSKR